MDAIYRAQYVHLLYIFFFFFISQGRVSSEVSFPWKAVLSSSCLPNLGSPGGPVGRGDPL